MKKALSIVMCIALLLAIPMKAEAKEDLRLMQYVSTEDTLQLYVSGENEIQGVTGQIARTAVEIVATEMITDIHTIILIDNSLSVTEPNQKKIAAILETYINQKAPEEKVSLAVYGEDITYLIERETDSSKILEAVAGIVYENKDSYFTDILYDEMEKLNNKTEYTRFIVATDGVDNKAIGYTKEEVTEYLKQENYPIYALGCVYKENNTELENLFAISRLTNANYYLLDEYEEYTDIISGLNETIQKIVFEVPEEYRNGSEQSVLITMETENGSVDISGKFSMPFQVEVVEEPVMEEPVEEVVEEVVEEPVVVEPVVVEPVVEEPAEQGIDFVTIGAIALIVIVLVVFLVLQLTKKKNKNKEGMPPQGGMPGMPGMPPQGGMPGMPPQGGRPGMPPQGGMMPPGGQVPPMWNAPYEEEEGTVLLNANKKTLTLRDRNSGKMFSYPISSEGVVIARSREAGAHIAINYSASISRKQHCKISMANNRNYVEDMNSSNGTFINGRQIFNKTEIHNGDVLTIGEVELDVTIN